MSWYDGRVSEHDRGEDPHVWPVHAIVVWCRTSACMFVARFRGFVWRRFHLMMNVSLQ